jgi:hypothetical protein
VFSHRRGETQASLECIVFSFLTIEAAINYLFLIAHPLGRAKSFESWLQKKWKGGSLSVYDRFVLLTSYYADGRLDGFQHLTLLFLEFINFRNRIVHAHPERYQALVQPGCNPDEFLIHDVQPEGEAKHHPASGLSAEIGRINLDDADRAFEIMVLMLCFLDEQFFAQLELPRQGEDGKDQQVYLRPREVLESIGVRHYPKLDPDSFVPEYISKMKAPPSVESDGK